MWLSIPTWIVIAALGQTSQPQTPAESADTAAAKERAAERLDFMKKSVTVYEPTWADEARGAKPNVDALGAQKTRAKPTLEIEPLLRWTDLKAEGDGTLFLWTSAGRPVAIAQMFSVEGGRRWPHEFQSLSPHLFSFLRDGRSVWSPEAAGIEFKPLPDAPPPARTAAQRLAQMHSMARLFDASDDYGNRDNIWQLRLLSRPVYRYPKADTEAKKGEEEVIDGAVFAFVVGTDPEMLLLFEARRNAAGFDWLYGLAPMTSFALQASHSGKQVWSCPFRGAPFRPNNPFFTLEYVP
jgi:hypothetical protein